MMSDARLVPADLRKALASRLDEADERMDRSRSWINRQALTDWLAEEQRRYDLTLEAPQDRR